MLWGHCSIDLLTIWNDCCETLALCQTKKMKILKNREWPVLKKGSHSGCFSQPGEVLQQCAPAYCFFAHLGETGLFGRKWFQTSPEKKVDQICWVKKILQQSALTECLLLAKNREFYLVNRNSGKKFFEFLIFSCHGQEQELEEFAWLDESYQTCPSWNHSLFSIGSLAASSEKASTCPFTAASSTALGVPSGCHSGSSLWR